MSLFSRLRAVVSGDDYLDGDYDDELDYDPGDEPSSSAPPSRGSLSSSSALALTSDFGADDPFGSVSSPSNVIGMPGLSSSAAEVTLMEPRSFDEMPRAIQALRDRKTVILNLTMMEPDQAQRAVDFVAGGTFAIDGHQERVGESIFLFAPSCVTVTTASGEEPSSPTIVPSPDSSGAEADPAAPSPAWGRQDSATGFGL
ncbi:cell division protein SepF [Synechococcus sp. BSF8S]|uniref:cell division protein SepF n=1 Tax=Synechococcales TaxID=1890424 RepID=UPI0016258719|nr:cell division protein SepF [Synechococcus sp. CS-205]MBC1262332.1 cell division protein SepF [Synechococcus sp. BSF8S]MBC1265235.1 cell division protein SepF [Synechococcus sp. BSA11S]MCT0249277.1 cell division protein SepF [Synechococcus sp. CS-205]